MKILEILFNIGSVAGLVLNELQKGNAKPLSIHRKKSLNLE